MAGTRAQKYRPEIIEQLRKKLASLPEMMPKEITRSEVVHGLSKQIGALKKRGYSMNAIAEVISAEGVAITGATLRGCLGESRGKRRAIERRRSRDASGNGRVNVAATPPVMRRERQRDGGMKAAENPVVIGGDPVRDKSADGDVGGNRHSREKSKVAEQERSRGHARGTSGNSAGNQSGGSRGMARQRSVDASGDSVETAAIHRGHTKESRLEKAARSHGWIDQQAPTTLPDNAGTALRGARHAAESRAGFVVREDTPDI